MPFEYLVASEAKKQVEAEVFCNKWGGNLVSIADLSEQKYVSNIFTDHAAHWLGMTYLEGGVISFRR